MCFLQFLPASGCFLDNVFSYFCLELIIVIDSRAVQYSQAATLLLLELELCITFLQIFFSVLFLPLLLLEFQLHIYFATWSCFIVHWCFIHFFSVFLSGFDLGQFLLLYSQVHKSFLLQCPWRCYNPIQCVLHLRHCSFNL